MISVAFYNVDLHGKISLFHITATKGGTLDRHSFLCQKPGNWIQFSCIKIRIGRGIAFFELTSKSLNKGNECGKGFTM